MKTSSVLTAAELVDEWRVTDANGKNAKTSSALNREVIRNTDTDEEDSATMIGVAAFYGDARQPEHIASVLTHFTNAVDV